MGSLSSYLAQQQEEPAVPAPAATYTPATEYENTGSGVSGLVGNLFSDVGDIVGGLFRFVGQGVAEVVTNPIDTLKEVGTLGFAETENQIATPTILKDIVFGFGEDVKDRYLDGDIAAEMYDHPLAPILDILTLAGGAGAAGRAATGTGMVAGKVGRAVLGAERVAQNVRAVEALRAGRAGEVAVAATPAIGEVLETGRALGAAEGGLRSLVEVYRGASPAGRKAMQLDVLTPESLKFADPVSGTVGAVEPTRNPLVRALWSDPLRKNFFGDSMEPFYDEIATLREARAADALVPEELNRLKQMESIASRAEAGGATFFAKPYYAGFRMRRAMDSMLGHISLSGSTARRDVNRGLSDIHRQAGIDEDTIEEAQARLVGDQVLLPEAIPVAVAPGTGPGAVGPAVVTMPGSIPAVPTPYDPMRPLPISRLEDTYGDGRSMQQIPDAEGNLDPAELRARAYEASGSTMGKLRAAFGGKSVSRGTGLKLVDRLAKRLDEGGRGLDALRARITVDTVDDIDGAVARLDEAGFDVLGVEDTRAGAEFGGRRGVKAYVRDRDAPDIISEIEVGTPLFNVVRNTTDHLQGAFDDAQRQLAQARENLELQRMTQDPDAIETAEAAVQLLETRVESGRRYMEGIYEQLTDELEGRASDQWRTYQNNMRLWVANELERRLMDNGTEFVFDFDRALERAYLPMRMRAGAEFVDGNFTNARYSTWDLDDIRKAEGAAQPIYFPYASEDDIHAYYVGRSGQGQRKLSKNKAELKNTGVLIETGDYIKNPRKAYELRAARAIKMLDTYDMVSQITRRFGRRISSPEELVDGEALFAPDFAMAFFRAVIGVDDRIGALLSKMDTEDLIGDLSIFNVKGKRNVAEAAESIIEEGLRGQGVAEAERHALTLAVQQAMEEAQRSLVAVTRQGVDIYAVPKVVSDRLQKSVKYQGGINQRLFWDTPLQMWKAITLYGRPAWVVNNILGNTVFSALGGVKMREVVRAALDPQYRAYVDQLAIDAGVEPAVLQNFVQSADVQPRNLGIAAESAMGKRYVKGAEAAKRKVRWAYKYADWWKRLNTDVENTFRAVGFVEGLRKADTELLGQGDARLRAGVARDFWKSKDEMIQMGKNGVTPERAERAVQLMNQWFGDYGNLSPIERNVLRRYIFPFWGFYRHVGQLLVRTPFDYPGKLAAVRVLGEIEKDMRAERGFLPSWMDGMVPFGGIGPDGRQRFLSVSGPNPFNVFQDVSLSLLNPFLKAGIEQVTGRDSFTGRQFTDPDVFTPYGSDQQYRVVRDADGKPVDAVPVERVVPGLGVGLLSNIPHYDMLRSVAAGGRPYDTQGILGSLGNPQTTSTGETVSPYGPQDMLMRLMGASTSTYNVAGYRERNADEREQALNEALERWALANGV